MVPCPMWLGSSKKRKLDGHRDTSGVRAQTPVWRGEQEGSRRRPRREASEEADDHCPCCLKISCLQDRENKFLFLWATMSVVLLWQRPSQTNMHQLRLQVVRGGPGDVNKQHSSASSHTQGTTLHPSLPQHTKKNSWKQDQTLLNTLLSPNRPLWKHSQKLFFS